jgi:putative membrane protein
MKADAFFTDEAKRRTREAIAAIEKTTAGEVVVAVRNSAWDYRHVDYLVGFGAALAALVGLLFLPQPFLLVTWPLDLVVAFVVGALVSSGVPAIRRLLTPRRQLDEMVRQAARVAFFDLGISRTRDRSGVLIFVSLLERRAEVVADLGLDPLTDDAAWKKALGALDQAIRQGPDLERFLAGLGALGEPLARLLGRREDDVNELPDEVFGPSSGAGSEEVAS